MPGLSRRGLLLGPGAAAAAGAAALAGGGLAPGALASSQPAMSAAENLILTISARGLGKLSSSHDYPVRGRGGMGGLSFSLSLLSWGDQRRFSPARRLPASHPRLMT